MVSILITTFGFWIQVDQMILINSTISGGTLESILAAKLFT